MTKLNLLPWRELRRKEQDRQLVSAGGFTWVLMALIIFYAHLHVSALIDNQKKRNEFLKEEIAKVDKEIQEIKELKKQRRALIARMNIIHQLQGDRTQIVHVFDELVQQLPEGIYFRKLSQKGKVFSVDGTAQSNARVSALMRNLDSSDWFTNPVLKVINVKDSDGDRVSNFQLKVTQADTQPKEKDQK